ncbi:MAG: hypothetical protein AABY22_29195 [Nanoarchaeota archaeon]
MAEETRHLRVTTCPVCRTDNRLYTRAELSKFDCRKCGKKLI